MTHPDASGVRRSSHGEDLGLKVLLLQFKLHDKPLSQSNCPDCNSISQIPTDNHNNSHAREEAPENATLANQSFAKPKQSDAAYSTDTAQPVLPPQAEEPNETPI